MNFAEGKGPKQVKTTYVLGQFVSIYGDGSATNYNPAAVPYPTQLSGAVPGGIVPGLVLSGAGSTDIGFICSPGANESVQDLTTIRASLQAEIAWSGTANVYLQGTVLRYVDNDDFSSTNWVTIASGQVTTANVPVVLYPSGNVPTYNAYRITASATTASGGIIDWALPGLFTDYSAMGIGANAGDLNGSVGQMSIQAPKRYAISGGQFIAVVESGEVTGAEYPVYPTPLENTKANHNWIG